jgi:two-component system sensor histidine kinase/response regulator
MPNSIKRLKQLGLFCFFMLAIGITCSAQTTKVDELLSQLNKNSPDTTQMKIMRKLSVAYSSVDPAKKFYYANQYKQVAEKYGIDSLVASAYLDMGNSYVLRSNLDSGLYYFKVGHEKAKACNFTNGIARGYINIGYVYDRLDRKKEAADYYEIALKLYTKLNFKRGINQCITNLGSIYFDLKEYKTADLYFQQVLDNVKENPNDEVGLGNALYSLGGSRQRLGKLKESLQYYQKSLAIREKIGDLNGIALSNWGIGELYVGKEEYNKALDYLNIALKNNRTLKNLYQECAVLMTLADAYLGLKDYKNAEASADLAITRAKETDSKIAMSLSLDKMAKVKAAQKKFDEALMFQAAYKAINDSLKTDETTKEIITSDLHRINTDNSVLTKDNKTIKSKNSEYVTVIAIITILLILLAVLLALYIKRNLEKKTINLLLQKQKQEIAEVNEELSALNEELTTQMDIVSVQNIELEKLNIVKNKFFSIVSHDLRSPLNSLKMIFELYRKGDLNEKELGELLTRLEDTIYTTASFLDNLLEWSKTQLEGMIVKPSPFEVSKIVADNMKLMESQIKLKSLKVENKISSDVTAFADPNMINTVVRNLLSNAIKFCNKGDEVIFDAEIKGDKMTFTIRDSGPGISESDKENLFNLAHTISTGTAGEKGHHIGLVLCRDMLLQNNGDIQVESEFGKGTTFYISLPIGR